MYRVQYAIYHAPQEEGKDKKPCARLLSRGTRHMQDICDYLSQTSTLSSADIKGVIDGLANYIGRSLSDGYNVELEEVGNFSPSLKTIEKVNKKGETVYSAEVNGVNFRCSKKLKKRVGESNPQKVKRNEVSIGSLDERRERMIRHLKRNHHISLTQYAHLNDCSRYRAAEDMKLFKEAGLVGCSGYRTHRMYYLLGNKE